jgi:hypothetical protein
VESREPLTVRFPAGLLSRAREAKRTDRESLNDLIVEAVEREVRRREAVRADVEITELRERIRSRVGVHPDSTDLVRSLRDGSRDV